MLSKITARGKSIFYPKIIQFGTIRSGSTLVFNILRDTYPNRPILKRHKITNSVCKRYKTVVTYRHPLDALASSLIRYDLLSTEKNIKEHIQELKKFGLDDLMHILDHPAILKIKYETFFDNFDTLFNALEIYFGKSIPKAHRTKMKEKYHIDQVLATTSSYKNFSQYDEVSQFHGNHISKFKGKPNTHKDFFTPQQVAEIKLQLAPYIIKLGY